MKNVVVVAVAVVVVVVVVVVAVVVAVAVVFPPHSTSTEAALKTRCRPVIFVARSKACRNSLPFQHSSEVGVVVEL